MIINLTNENKQALACFCGHDEEHVKTRGYEFVLPLWQTIIYKYDFKNVYHVKI